MSQPVLVKAYASIWPASESLHKELSFVMRQAIPCENASLSLGNDLCCLFFEGVWFPAADALACISRHLQAGTKGKLDILDLESWILNRNMFEHGHVVSKNSPLNNVLDYSGF